MSNTSGPRYSHSAETCTNDEALSSTGTDDYLRQLALFNGVVLEAARRRYERLPGLVEALQDDVVLTSGGTRRRAHGWVAPRVWLRAGEVRPRRIHELFLNADRRVPFDDVSTAEQILVTLLHEACHVYALANDIPDTSRDGRYHNRRFGELAVAIGLVAVRDQGIGHRTPRLSEAGLSDYSDLLTQLEDGLVLTREPVRSLRNGDGSDNTSETSPEPDDESQPVAGSSKYVFAACRCTTTRGRKVTFRSLQAIGGPRPSAATSATPTSKPRPPMSPLQRGRLRPKCPRSAPCLPEHGEPRLEQSVMRRTMKYERQDQVWERYPGRAGYKPRGNGPGLARLWWLAILVVLMALGVALWAALARSHVEAPAGEPAVSAPVAPAATTPPSPTGQPNRIDQLPYRADATNGWPGWTGVDDWALSGAQLHSIGESNRWGAGMLAPLDLSNVDNYAVDADIQLLRNTDEGMFSGVTSFGVLVKGQNDGDGYTAGPCVSSGILSCASSQPGPHVVGLWAKKGDTALDVRPFRPDTGWHHYRVEVRGNTMTVMIDGNQMLTAADNTYLAGGKVGVFSYRCQVSVRSFEVTPL